MNDIRTHCANPRPCRRPPAAFPPAPFLCCVLCLIFAALCPPFPAQAFSGRDVYEKVQEVRSRALDRKAEATMTLFDRGGGSRTRTLTQYSKKADPDAYKSLIVFHSPPDLKDVGFLIRARTFSDRSLWAYFPEYKRVRRIATTSQDDSFFGSDFSYDDFSGPPNLDDYRFRIVREDSVAQLPCHVVEVTPQTHRRYTKYLAWIARDLWIPLKIDYYRGSEIYRSGTFRDVRTVDGIPTPFRIDMENRKTNHRTALVVGSVKYRARFPDDLFSLRSLERAGK